MSIMILCNKGCNMVNGLQQFKRICSLVRPGHTCMCHGANEHVTSRSGCSTAAFLAISVTRRVCSVYLVPHGVSKRDSREMAWPSFTMKCVEKEVDNWSDSQGILRSVHIFSEARCEKQFSWCCDCDRGVLHLDLVRFVENSSGSDV